ncbi:hypothetical protein [Halobaculum magnesiiphilum]|uniref:Uncharacterized protein n=1 Tax=Halobaculum magnesiiphilum TaxID=1017351 RepID=A0A8T8WFB6_9EURY|nr:hypothetical protein [Halobaculum magnesiiphilum]QZP38531.1 hypothetical protein K6T50_05155 [Halobaculum magnesiiphilum]
MSADDTAEPGRGETTTWPDFGIALYERLTGRGAEISYTFDDLEVDVPSSADEDATHAHWRFNGTLRISSSEQGDRGEGDREE